MTSRPRSNDLTTRESDSCGIGFVADIQGRRRHRILELALEALSNLSHRGAVAADGRTGDGVGVLTQLPTRFLSGVLADQGLPRIEPSDLAAGVFFLPPDAEDESRRLIAEEIVRGGLELITWRHVPTQPEILGAAARRGLPAIWQAIIQRPATLDADEFERRLYLIRRRIEHRSAAATPDSGEASPTESEQRLYVVSMSHRTLVYKGMSLASELADFYPDLQDRRFETSLALFHQRFSTNTLPSWPLAQPFRMLAHNGEINTIQGNANWMAARERELTSSLWDDQIRELLPILDSRGSDSAMLDNALELSVMFGRDPLHSMMMLIPEARRGDSDDPRLEAFYDFHATLMEPWDGPAAVVFSDGRIAAACLDRNGLRPQRYWLTHDDLVILGSETGLVDLEPDSIRLKGRLGPGEILAVDTEAQELLDNREIKRRYSRRQPYDRWVRRHLVEPPTFRYAAPIAVHGGQDLAREQRVFGYSREVFERILEPMMTDGQQPIGSMGDDTPPAILSTQPQLLYAYFKQRFAQVTNPPIDPIRERDVLTLETMVGPWGSILGEHPEAAHLVRMRSPILRAEELAWLLALDDPSRNGEHGSRFQTATLRASFPAAAGEEGLQPAVQELCKAVERAVDNGASLIVLSDRDLDADSAPIPMLLATAAVHHHLIRQRKRMQVSLICDTGEPREDHHFACLIGYGATLIHPHLIFHSLAEHAQAQDQNPDTAIKNYLQALESGLLKIMSKLGVCPIASYQGAQLFEAFGLDQDLIDECFTGTPSRVGGVGWRTIAASVLTFHREAWAESATDSKPGQLTDRGHFRFRKQGEYHSLNPQVFKALHKAVRRPAPESFSEFAARSDDGPPVNLRDLLTWRRAEAPLALEDVEPVESIVQRFSTAAMSLGALSREAHESLAIAMNRLGGRSNSGEGGEDPARFNAYTEERPAKPFLGRWQPEAGDLGRSAIKQIASGRFGVTAHYLVSASELEIKMAQGSKPGEGGQIPGRKVSAEIAERRRSVPGVPLISPPPHHDIYSIEDLAQLIYDLKRVNPGARVAVKLVAIAGVGTIAAGVAKGYADVIQISGDCGGTGSSPLSSIKHAGMPWELGLAETQQMLVQFGLRDRITLKVDGGLKTGRDIVLAALLGAEEFGFGTIPLIALGCIMARQCHLDTCPVGIATQREELRRRFAGTPEHVMAYMLGVAEQVREILAEMGLRKLDDAVGRIDLLERRQRTDRRTERIDLSRLLVHPGDSDTPRRCARKRNMRPQMFQPLDQQIWLDCRPALHGHTVRRTYVVGNSDRSLGARLSGEIARATDGQGLSPGRVILDLDGVAGQSLGAFLVRGVSLRLTGEAQDYVGKGMSGGEIALRPPGRLADESQDHVIAGNTVLYGATGGRCFLGGRVGERFCVRNSGVQAVVEGCGDHGCEYMTGGVAVILGTTGRNFGAGMSGGVAFVLEKPGLLDRIASGVHAERLTAGADQELLRDLISRHAWVTGSRHAQELLEKFNVSIRRFYKVSPVEPEPVTSPALFDDRAAKDRPARPTAGARPVLPS